MRSYKAVILEAELLASPPAAVAAFLKDRSERLKADRFNDDVDEELEAALRDRNQPLISLALVRHAQFATTVQAMFDAAESGSAVRLAVLANTTLSGMIFSRFPSVLFGGDGAMAAWLATAPVPEITALFENPKLNNTFLCDLLERKGPWSSIAEERLATFVAILARNERMRTPYDERRMDGYAEYSYGAVFNAAWKLAGTVPANERWSMALRWLYDLMETDAFSIDQPLDLVARWVPDPANAELAEQEAKEVSRGWLSNFQGVRKGLGRLALSKNPKLLGDLLASDDAALRSAAYADGALSPEQLAVAYDKDGEIVFNQAMHNRNIWRVPAARTALRKVAWAVVKNDKHSDLSAANIFNSIREEMLKKHPEWFVEDGGFTLEPSDQPATKADLQALLDRLAEPSSGQTIEQLKQSLQAINSRVGWVIWFSLGALVAGIWRL